MHSPLEEIKSRLDVVDLIQSYVRLQKAGINYKANCPFHGEKTPSFFVSPSRQIWHCFGCGKGGDIFKFIMEIEGHEFPEAMRLLAQRAGVELRREDPAIRSEKNRLYDICEEATKIFERSFALTPAAGAYIQNRGAKAETLKEFRVGFAPQSWDYLLKALLQKGFKKEEITAAGLAVKSEEGNSWYDRFRSRIMFPITDGNSRVVGFSGRIFEEAGSRKQEAGRTEAKYVNTPNTLIYDKSRVLYGFDRAKQDIRAKNQVIIVEGQMDCVMSHQAGVKNTIAVSGTALTPQQLKIISRLCNTMVCSFDTDTAGDSATRRSLALASQFEFERKIAVIPAGKDPADAVLENPQSWVRAVEDAKPVVEFYFAKAFRDHAGSTPQGKKAISAAVLPWVSELGNEIEKMHWVGKLATGLGVSEAAVGKELEKVKKGDFLRDSFPVDSKPLPARRELLEERFLALLPLMREEVRERELHTHELAFVSSLNGQLFSALRAGSPELLGTELGKHLELLRFKGEIIVQAVGDAEEEFSLCKKELEKECIKERLQALSKEIADRERSGDESGTAAMLANFRLLSQKLQEFSSR